MLYCFIIPIQGWHRSETPVRSRLQPLFRQHPPFTIATCKLLAYSLKLTSKPTYRPKHPTKPILPSREHHSRPFNTIPPMPKAATTLSKTYKEVLLNASHVNCAKKEEKWIRVLPKTLQKNLAALRKSDRLAFIKLKLQQLKQQGRCFKCLQKGHKNTSCKRTFSCMACGRSGHPIGKFHFLSNYNPMNKPVTNVPIGPHDTLPLAKFASKAPPIIADTSINTTINSTNLQLTNTPGLTALTITNTLLTQNSTTAQTNIMAVQPPPPPPFLLPQD